MYMHNTNDIGIYLINDVVIFTFKNLDICDPLWEKVPQLLNNNL